MRSELPSPSVSPGYRTAMAASSVPCFVSEEQGGAEDQDLLPRVPFGRGRRRPPSESHGTSITSSALPRYRSFSRDVGHAAAETYLLTSLSLVLLRLDLYLPMDDNDYKPVMVFVTGGAWIIGRYDFGMTLQRGSIRCGRIPLCEDRQQNLASVDGTRTMKCYKAWGSLLGRRLAERGIIVASIDYRNFPQGTISDMIRDVSQGISFVCNNIAVYGGDPNRIFLMGQSAGAHIAACSLLRQAIKECKGDTITWSVSQIKAFFGLSGGYNMLNLVDHFHRRGLYRSIFLSIMEGEHSLKCFSPEVAVMDSSAQYLLEKQMKLFLVNCPYKMSHAICSITFAEALHSVGVQARVILYEGKTHMDLFIHDPLRGGRDELLEDIVSEILSNNAAAVAKHAVPPPAPRLAPELLLQLARKISPF
ncbi:Isoprenylcysteine alpha-carbonyl methylesterase ICME [Apostasia shenzhenica]|uniref:protein-S-isoprenylcysteine alpha-carbonyl methylesterase n=1 Tax=Apostasia shenzhenica TaxID=1088818 RepID=A0A2I0A170_9ASPA|nr:Isoprenylcysteine alpha-carbonyl methylesterase ICME [Apostasia shenzhenica]